MFITCLVHDLGCVACSKVAKRDDGYLQRFTLDATRHDLTAANFHRLVWRASPAQTREEILKVSMAQNRVDASVNFTAITAELEGFTGSDIKEVRYFDISHVII